MWRSRSSHHAFSRALCLPAQVACAASCGWQPPAAAAEALGRSFRTAAAAASDAQHTAAADFAAVGAAKYRPPVSGSVLKRHGRDLTLDASEGRLDPLLGREDVVRRALHVSRGVGGAAGGPRACASCQPCQTASPPARPFSSPVQVLLRRTKNNPVLLGDPGVGKTAVAEGLAQLIVSPGAPPGLRGRALISLDVGSLVAGTQYRGAFEERITVGARRGSVMLAGWGCMGLLGRPGRRSPSHLLRCPFPLPRSRCSTRCGCRRGASSCSSMSFTSSWMQGTWRAA